MDIGPCTPWSAIICCDLTGKDPLVTGYALQAATEVLWAVSGRQFGECIVENIYPCPADCAPATNALPDWPRPQLISGQWFNLGCAGSCLGSCACNTPSRFVLPQGVSRVLEIEVDGEVVPTGSYRIENNRYVVRTDGISWPMCNDGTWTLTVAIGAEVPRSGEYAVGELLCEIVKLCSNEECKLPLNAKRVTRQGVTVDTTDVLKLVEQGVLGLTLVNMFVGAFNPKLLMGNARSYSPDVPRTRWTR